LPKYNPPTRTATFDVEVNPGKPCKQKIEIVPGSIEDRIQRRLKAPLRPDRISIFYERKTKAYRDQSRKASEVQSKKIKQRYAKKISNPNFTSEIKMEVLPPVTSPRKCVDGFVYHTKKYNDGPVFKPAEDSSEKITIYALIDRKTYTVRYVGETSNFYARMRSHRDRNKPDNNSNLLYWKREVDYDFRMDILAVVSVSDLVEAERAWIAYFRARGRLYNIEHGGNDSQRFVRPDPWEFRPEVTICQPSSLNNRNGFPCYKEFYPGHPSFQKCTDLGQIFYIYALLDTTDSTVRFVGKTNKIETIAKSHKKHVLCTSKQLDRWKRKIHYRYEVQVLACVSRQHRKSAEKQWIFYFKSLGQLYNYNY
jgi:hypothetical protein